MDKLFESQFFGALVVGFMALLGVFYSLREERIKAKEEREFLVKQQALVSAAEAVTRFLNYYITLPDRELPKDGVNPTEVLDLSVTLNSLHFYCNIDTIEKTVSMGQILSKAFTSALKAKLPCIILAEEIRALEMNIASMEKFKDELQQKILALLSSGPSHPLLGSLNQQLAEVSTNISGLYDRKIAFTKEKYYKTEACRDVIAKDLKEIYTSLQDILLMARKELSFPIDETRYKTKLNQATESSIANMETLFDEIRKEIAKKFKSMDGLDK